jgi:hypothetical protein
MPKHQEQRYRTAPGHDVLILRDRDDVEVWLEPYDGKFIGLCLSAASTRETAVAGAIEALEAAIAELRKARRDEMTTAEKAQGLVSREIWIERRVCDLACAIQFHIAVAPTLVSHDEIQKWIDELQDLWPIVARMKDEG